jgi:hypothetical protein
MQVCKRDWINAVWTLKSFRYWADRPFRLVLHRDTADHDLKLEPNQLDVLRRQFPGIVVPSREKVAQLVQQHLEPVAPRISSMWYSGQYFTLSKVVDTLLLAERRRIIVLDPDVLFFDRPDELLDVDDQEPAIFARFNVLRNKMNIDGMYCIDAQAVREHYGLELPVRFGTGLGWLWPEMCDWALLDQIVSDPQIELNERAAFMIDQTLLGLVCVEKGYEPLSVERYAIEPVDSLDGVVARHYYSKTRHLMYREGIRRLTNTRFLDRYQKTC